MSAESQRRRPEDDTSGLSSGTATWVQRHADELDPLLEVSEPFRFADLDDISKSVWREAITRNVISSVDLIRHRGDEWHSWRVDPRAREIVENVEYDDRLPCGHRVNFTNTPEGYECNVCGAIHTRDVVEAVL